MGSIKKAVKFQMGFTGLRQGSMAGSCGNGNETY
jgi:hypothetical protein